jgi:hypothetical protein
MHTLQDAAVPLLADGQTAATKDVLNRAFVELAKVRALQPFAVNATGCTLLQQLSCAYKPESPVQCYER